ncbi:MAG: TfoX/Sxy family protein [Flavobacteriales bacterium]|nr:TfoX/Sxy family protein [Flavobacteriales bacterium]
MAYDNYLEERIDKILNEKGINFTSKKMMGGLCYLVDDKMCLGIIKDNLMARVGPDAYEEALAQPGAREMDFTKRTMTGYVYVTPDSIDKEDDLEFWIEKCLSFNPKAKSSKKK